MFAGRELTLGELSSTARTVKTALLAFFHATVSSQEPAVS